MIIYIANNCKENRKKPRSLSTSRLLVREAGLEVAVPNSNNFLMSNYVINSSESVLLCTTQSIDFMWCDSVKGQICGQKVI